MDANYKFANVRSAAILTTSYVAGTILGPKGATGYEDVNCAQFDQLVLYVDFTKGSLTSLEVKVEFSHDNSAYYQETFSSVSTGTSTESIGEHTMTATGKYRLEIPIHDQFIKVSVKGTGTVTSSSCKVDAVLVRQG